MVPKAFFLGRSRTFPESRVYKNLPSPATTCLRVLVGMKFGPSLLGHLHFTSWSWMSPPLSCSTCGYELGFCFPREPRERVRNLNGGGVSHGGRGSSEDLQVTLYLLEQGSCASSQWAAHLPRPHISSGLPGPTFRPGTFLVLQSGTLFTFSGGIFSQMGVPPQTLDQSPFHIAFIPLHFNIYTLHMG